MEKKGKISWFSSSDEEENVKEPIEMLKEMTCEMKKQLKERKRMVQEQIKFNALLADYLEKVENYIKGYEIENLIEKVL